MYNLTYSHQQESEACHNCNQLFAELASMVAKLFSTVKEDFSLLALLRRWKNGARSSKGNCNLYMIRNHEQRVLNMKEIHYVSSTADHQVGREEKRNRLCVE